MEKPESDAACHKQRPQGASKGHNAMRMVQRAQHDSAGAAFSHTLGGFIIQGIVAVM